MKGWYSAKELAEMGLAGMPMSKKGVIDLVTREKWKSKKREGKGGGFEYQPPESILKQINNTQLISAVVEVKKALPAVEVAPVDTAALSTHQRDVMQARDNLIKFVQIYQGSVSQALAHINQAYEAGLLNAHLTWSLKHAWDKPREPLTLTRDTYNKWVAVKKTRGVAAPLKPQKDMSVKPWHAAAIALKQRPQGTTHQYILDTLQSQYPYLSYGMINRFFAEKFSKIDALKGRHTGSALKSHMKYNKRDTSGIEPWGELHMDGWNTHFTAPHPVSGEFVTYEIWHAHDIATKYTPPVSIGLTENFEVIAKCIENAIRFGGVPRIIQTDSTKVIKNSARMKTDPHTALSERFGFTFVHPHEVGNSRANGTPENFNTSLDRESRELATYQGKGMDSLTLKRVKKITAKMVKAQHEGDAEQAEILRLEAQKQGKGLVFTSYQEALDWINCTIDKLNNRPHRSLPKIADATTGKMRHQTPAEALKAAFDTGWQPLKVPEDVLINAFRTHVKVKVTSQMVKPYGRMYYQHPALDHMNGETVVVVYDSMNYEQVVVKSLDGTTICVANYRLSVGRSQSFQAHTEEKRALAQIKLRQTQIEQIKQNTPSLTGVVIDGHFAKGDDLIAVEHEMPQTPQIDQAFVHELPEKEVERSWSETLMWLHGEDDKPKNEDLAVGSAN